MNNPIEPSVQDRTARLTQVLAQLAERGVKQSAIACELNVPPQYVSDLRHGRRNLSEPFARRFAEAYRVSASWLLLGEGPRDLPDLAAPGAQSDGACLLPVLSSPDEGDPRHSPHWDGGLLALAGAAAAAAARAKLPFVLRIEGDSPSGRLRKNDLILCCQGPRDDAAFVIVRAAGTAVLAEAAGKDRYKAVASGRLIPGAEPIGHGIGIVWAPLLMAS